MPKRKGIQEIVSQFGSQSPVEAPEGCDGDVDTDSHDSFPSLSELLRVPINKPFSSVCQPEKAGLCDTTGVDDRTLHADTSLDASTRVLSTIHTAQTGANFSASDNRTVLSDVNSASRNPSHIPTALVKVLMWWMMDLGGGIYGRLIYR